MILKHTFNLSGKVLCERWWRTPTSLRRGVLLPCAALRLFVDDEMAGPYGRGADRRAPAGKPRLRDRGDEAGRHAPSDRQHHPPGARTAGAAAKKTGLPICARPMYGCRQAGADQAPALCPRQAVQAGQQGAAQAQDLSRRTIRDISRQISPAMRRWTRSSNGRFTRPPPLSSSGTFFGPCGFQPATRPAIAASACSPQRRSSSRWLTVLYAEAIVNWDPLIITSSGSAARSQNLVYLSLVNDRRRDWQSALRLRRAARRSGANETLGKLFDDDETSQPCDAFFPCSRCRGDQKNMPRRYRA